MGIKVYVAGGSDERLDRARPVIEFLQGEGITVPYDWTRSPGYDRELTPAESEQQARLDFDAIRAADIVWIMAPAAKSEGAATELGIALALGKTVFISGRYAVIPSRLFNLLAGRIFSSDAAALREVLRAVKDAA